MNLKEYIKITSLVWEDPLEKGEFHRQRSLVGYSPWGTKELDMTEQLTLLLLNIHIFCFYTYKCADIRCTN